jgi:4-amino-4-deoxy-L-arabinose transferase-like glycosyltransferase
MQYGKTEKYIFLILLGVLLVTLVSGLNIDVTRDAAKYAYIAKEIIHDGQWVNLQIDGEPYEQKPHLMFWLSALSFMVFGVSNFAFKLPMLLYSFAGVYFTYRLGKSIEKKETGFIAAIMASFSVLFILYNQDLHTDTPLFASTAFALWMLYEYLQGQRTRYLIGSGLALGLCLMTKGVFGVVFPFLTVLGYLLVRKEWRKLFNPKWLIVVLIAFAISTPVFYMLYHNWGIEGFKFFFFENTYGRFTGKYLGHTPDPFYYFHNIAYLFLPWSLLFFASFYLFFKRLKNRRITTSDHFLFTGFLMFFVIMTVSISKLPNYLMGLLSVMSIITAKAWIDHFSSSRRIIKAQSVIPYLIWLIVPVALIFFKKEGLVYAIFIFLFIFIISIFLTRKLAVQNRVFMRSLIAITVAGIVLNFMVLPVLFGHQAQPKAAEWLNKNNPEGTKVFNYPKSHLKHLRHLWTENDTLTGMDFNQTPPLRHFSYNYELKFYSNQFIGHVETPNELAAALSNSEAWFYTDEEGKLELMGKTMVDTILVYQHFSLKRTAKYFFPDEGKSPFVPYYLVKTSNATTN